jgi:hypothetical protein
MSRPQVGPSISFSFVYGNPLAATHEGRDAFALEPCIANATSARLDCFTYGLMDGGTDAPSRPRKGAADPKIRSEQLNLARIISLEGADGRVRATSKTQE